MDELLLNVDAISFSYAKEPIWNNVSFSIKPGEIAFLFGSNGAGKSTLLKCLAGWLRPSSGKIDFAYEGERGSLMLVTDVPAFYDDLTAQEHVSLLLKSGEFGGREAYVDDLLEEIGLGRYLNQYPSTYSRGMRLKLALVLALTVRPKLLLLDEPYGALDAEASAILDREIVRLCEEGSSVIASCHSRSPGISPDIAFVLEEGGIRRA